MLIRGRENALEEGVDCNLYNGVEIVSKNGLLCYSRMKAFTHTERKRVYEIGGQMGTEKKKEAKVKRDKEGNIF